MKFIKIILVILLTSSSALAQEKALRKPIISASINPIYQILLAITKDESNSILIINPNFSEHDYQLKKSDAKKFFISDLIFYVDDDLEKNFAKLAKEKKSYQLSQVIGIKLLQRLDNPKKIDVHLWMNPQNATKIAEFMTQKICEIDVGNCKKYQTNLQKFRDQILKTEKIIDAKLAKIKNENYVFYHDGYQYFTDYFSLKPLKIISRNHDYELTLKDARDFDLLARTTAIKCLFSDVNDEKNSALKLARNYKIKFVTLDLLQSKNGYADLLLDMADKMTECLK